jgi:hypothetical protein
MNIVDRVGHLIFNWFAVIAIMPFYSLYLNWRYVLEQLMTDGSDIQRALLKGDMGVSFAHYRDDD